MYWATWGDIPSNISIYAWKMGGAKYHNCLHRKVAPELRSRTERNSFPLIVLSGICRFLGKEIYWKLALIGSTLEFTDLIQFFRW